MRATVGTRDAPTGGATLRGIPGVHHENGDSRESRLVLNEGAELVEGPRVLLTTLRPANPDPRANALEFFEGNSSLRAFGLRHQPDANAVVYITGEAALLPPPLSKQPFGRPGAQGLESRSELGVALTEPVDPPTCVGVAIGVGGDVHDTQVNAQDVSRFHHRGLLDITDGIEVEVPVPVDQVGLSVARGQQLSLALASDVRDGLPALGSQDRDPVVQVAEDTVVVGDAAVEAECTLGLPVELVGVGYLSDSADRHLGAEAAVSSDLIVRELMQLVLAEDLFPPGEGADSIASPVGALQGLGESRGLFGIGEEFEVHYQLHASSIEHCGVCVSSLKGGKRIPLPAEAGSLLREFL